MDRKRPAAVAMAAAGPDPVPDALPAVHGDHSHVGLDPLGVIALFAAGLLTRDGVLVVLSLILPLDVPIAAWHFGFSA